MTYNRVDKYQAAISAHRPFEGHLLEQLRDYYRIGLTWASNALEGNTLDITETKVLLEDGLTAGGKPLRDNLEAVGHGKAYDYMFGLLGERHITVDDIKALHRLFYQGIDETRAGVWRDVPIMVTGTEYAFPAPGELDGLMQDVGQWAADERGRLHPVEFAAMLHLKFVTIHPFMDGNGRVARLIMNAALIQDGYMLAVVPPVLRTDYITSIKAYQLRGVTAPFCEFIAGRVIETQKEIMRLLGIAIPKP